MAVIPALKDLLTTSAKPMPASAILNPPSSISILSRMGLQALKHPWEMGQAVNAMGISIVNHANNHTFDGGVFGMVVVDEDGIGGLQRLLAEKPLTDTSIMHSLTGQPERRESGVFGRRCTLACQAPCRLIAGAHFAQYCL